MSIDYPNRAVWLAKRCTPRGRKRPVHGRIIWSGRTYVRKQDGPIGRELEDFRGN